jgi:guanine nucleotide-binding protein alpha-1 subunit
MVAAKSVPQNHLADPFEAVLRPPPDETPAERDARIRAEKNAKQVSDTIDEQLRAERTDLKKNKADVRILLLGQSESGKSTTLKRTFSTNFSPCHSKWAYNGPFASGHTRFGSPNTHTSVASHAHSLHDAEFQLLHTPAAFQAERVAWRIVIYLNLIRSIRRQVPHHHILHLRLIVS